MENYTDSLFFRITYPLSVGMILALYIDLIF